MGVSLSEKGHAFQRVEGVVAERDVAFPRVEAIEASLSTKDTELQAVRRVTVEFQAMLTWCYDRCEMPLQR